MLELKSKVYESKNSEEILNKALSELNASTNEVYYSVKEEVTGSIFKSKKYTLNIILKDDIVEYIAIYKPYYDSIARMSNNGLIIPYLKDERISSTLIKPYEISNEQENIKPYYISKERDKDIDRRLIDAYNSNRGYPFK